MAPRRPRPRRRTTATAQLRWPLLPQPLVRAAVLQDVATRRTAGRRVPWRKNWTARCRRGGTLRHRLGLAVVVVVVVGMVVVVAVVVPRRGRSWCPPQTTASVNKRRRLRGFRKPHGVAWWRWAPCRRAPTWAATWCPVASGSGGSGSRPTPRNACPCLKAGKAGPCCSGCACSGRCARTGWPLCLPSWCGKSWAPRSPSTPRCLATPRQLCARRSGRPPPTSTRCTCLATPWKTSLCTWTAPGCSWWWAPSRTRRHQCCCMCRPSTW